ncbi:SCO family protein [Actinospica sp. MGRD01-02]|uniref:SCO family protein n=1 Tax=Actinospica acidithermotolerans TaxID=2828514 RepID=A0A941EAK6_9ACTN|nr:SCO family protein [Actinospica acidithermotolerans]MBR7825534.1 SCO family protein [Actinospica acidithermotolerans]
MKLRTILATTIAVGLLGSVGACGASSSSASSGVVVDSTPTSIFDGDLLNPPYAKPDVTLTDSSGKQFNLVEGTKGKVTLVYFGYTHCPDVCPTTMATIAATMRTLTAAQAAQVDVVFISSDPKRDTPSVLKTWLGQYNPTFIGLTGDFSKIQSAAATLGVDLEAPRDTNGQYTVTHGAEVIAFDAKGKGDLLYTSGTSVPEFQHDIPLLLAGRDG